MLARSPHSAFLRIVRTSIMKTSMRSARTRAPTGASVFVAPRQRAHSLVARAKPEQQERVEDTQMDEASNADFGDLLTGFRQKWSAVLVRGEQAMRAASSKAGAVAGALSRAERAQREALAEVGEQLTKVLEQQEQEDAAAAAHTPAESLDQRLADVMAAVESTSSEEDELAARAAALDGRVAELVADSDARDAQGERLQDKLTTWAVQLEQRDAADAAARAEREARRREVEAEAAAAQAAAARALEAAATAEAAAAAEAQSALAAVVAETPPPQQPEQQPEAPQQIAVTLRVRCQTRPGQQVLVVGDHQALGSWSADAALPLKWGDGHVWSATLLLPAHAAGATLAFKSVLRDGSSGSNGLVWARGDNRTLAVADGAADEHAF